MSAHPTVSIQDNPDKHRFEAHIDGRVAVARYTLGEGLITFTHTQVPEALRGQGIAGQLVRAGLAAARERGLKVVPECQVFADYMQRHPDTQDLLAPSPGA